MCVCVGSGLIICSFILLRARSFALYQCFICQLRNRDSYLCYVIRDLDVLRKIGLIEVLVHLCQYDVCVLILVSNEFLFSAKELLWIENEKSASEIKHRNRTPISMDHYIGLENEY